MKIADEAVVLFDPNSQKIMFGFSQYGWHVLMFKDDKHALAHRDSLEDLGAQKFVPAKAKFSIKVHQ